jgi:hypothetical protein
MTPSIPNSQLLPWISFPISSKESEAGLQISFVSDSRFITIPKFARSNIWPPAWLGYFA